MHQGSFDKIESLLISFVLTGFVFLTSLVLIGSGLSYFKLGTLGVQFFEIYWVVIASIIWGLSLFIFKKNLDLVKLHLTQNIKTISGLFLIYSILFYILLWLNQDQSLWRDELFQFSVSKSFSSVEACRQQSQPPVACSLSFLWTQIFNNNPILFYIDNYLFGFLLFSLLFIYAKSRLGKVLSVLFVLIFGAHPQVLKYLLEFRPIILGLTLGAISLVFYHLENRKVIKSEPLLVFLIEVLSITTLGLQNLVLCLLLLVTRYFFKSKNFYYHGFAILVFLPIQVWILRGPVANSALAIDFVITDFSFSWLGTLNRLLGVYWIMFVACIGSLVFYGFKIKAKFDQLKTNFVLLFLFLFLMMTLFYWGLNIQLVDRYLMIAWVLSFFIMIELAAVGLKFIGLKWIYIVTLVSLIGLYPIHKIQIGDLNINYKNIFNYLSLEMKAHDRFVMFCLPRLSSGCYSFTEGATAAQIYFKPSDESIYRNQLDSINGRSAYAIFNLFKSNLFFDRLFIVVEKSPYLNDSDLIRQISQMPQTEVQIIKDEILIVLKGEPQQIIYRWFELLNSLNKDWDSSSKVLQAIKLEQDFLKVLFVDKDINRSKELYEKATRNEVFRQATWMDDPYYKFFNPY